MSIILITRVVQKMSDASGTNFVVTTISEKNPCCSLSV